MDLSEYVKLLLLMTVKSWEEKMNLVVALIKANGTIKLDLQSNKIVDFTKFDIGNVAMASVLIQMNLDEIQKKIMEWLNIFQ